jgi:hypothetical protein
MNLKLIATFLIPAVYIASSLTATATPVPYFTASGVQLLGNAQSAADWNVNATTESTAFELVFDLTTDMNGGNPYTLWSAGGSGSGADLVYENGNLHFWAGNSTDDVASDPIGLTAPQNQIQVVSLFTLNDSATDERLQIFVNGIEIANTLTDTANIWAGSDTAGLGIVAGTATHRYTGTALFTEADMQDYPNSNITFAAYRQNDPSWDLNALLIPEPSSLALVLLGFAGLATRFKRR